MRPLTLVMNAFGPYPDKITLDFADFQESNLFLVTGPTGAGKTTIFDALAYALFDEASGDSRDKDTFKSQFSKETDLCYVEMEFELKGKTYYIKRTPSQRGPGKSGKIIAIKPKAEFHHPNGVTTKKTEVNKEIQELLGLTYSQFKQIVMLPQGEFKKMLESNSGDKEIIFRNIFKTDELQYFQKELKEKASSLKKEFGSFEDSLKQTFGLIQAAGPKELEKAVEQFDAKKVLEELEGVLEKDNAELEKIKKELSYKRDEKQQTERFAENLKKKEELTEKVGKLTEESSRIESLEKQLEVHEKGAVLLHFKEKVREAEKDSKKEKKKLQKTKEEMTELLLERKEAQKQLDEAEGAYKSLPKKRQELGELQQELQRFEKTAAVELQIEKLNQSMKENKDKTAEQAEKLEETISAKAVFMEKLAQIDFLREKQAELLLSISKVEKNISHQEKEIEDLTKLEKKYKETLQWKESFEEAEEKYREAFLKSEEARKLYYKDLAGVLASELKEKEPCPVCGSLEHPKTAHVFHETITKAEYEKISQTTADLHGIFQKAEINYRQSAEAVKEKLEALGLKAESLAEDLLEQESILNDYKKNLNTLEKEQKTVFSELSQEKSWRKQADEKSEEEQLLSRNIAHLESEREHFEKRRAELKDELKELQRKIHFDSKEQAESAIEQTEEKIGLIESRYNSSQKNIGSLNEEKSALDKTMELTEETIKNSLENLAAHQETFLKRMEESQLEVDFEKDMLREEALRKYQQEIETHNNELLVAKDRLKNVQEYLNQIEDLKSLGEYQKEIGKLIEELPGLEQSHDKMVGIVNQNKQAKKEIEKYQQQSKKIEQDVHLYNELSSYANGCKETDYISFERYVLGIYFDQILAAANHRFLKMTNQRYMMKRKIEKAKGAGPQGLDIDVFDHYTGQERGVHTLSGGETFKASLSLALGLSDVIQNQNGGVSVDTLFIDEGFGTLDSDSLDSAIQALLDLNQKGRLVGIISHVEELKTRIPSHIEVEKTQTGSRAYIQM